MQGKDTAGLLNSATGSADFTWTSGSLRKLSLEGHPAPLSFSALSGIFKISQAKLSFENCEMKTNGAVFEVKGVATYDRNLNFMLQRAGGSSYFVVGSLEQPQVTSVPGSPLTRVQPQ
jgi:hypothetical protein